MIGCVGGQMSFTLTAKFGFEIEPGLILTTALGNIPREEAVRGKDHKPQGCEVQKDRDHSQYGFDFSQNTEKGADKEQDQLTNEKRIVEAVCTVSSVHKTGDFFMKFHTMVPFSGGFGYSIGELWTERITFWHSPT